ncbi:hypothetical protein BC940DRAFT_328757 [Gongronella butleri]|nr:hypothetical protein BC940DRAFT_328757 [Gongronella butleri]
MRYADVYLSVAGKDGVKLMVGTLTCNISVTLSLRIDKEEMPHVGATKFSCFLNYSTTEPITVVTLADHGNSKNSGAVLMSEVAFKVL